MLKFLIIPILIAAACSSSLKGVVHCIGAPTGNGYLYQVCGEEKTLKKHLRENKYNKYQHDQDVMHEI